MPRVNLTEEEILKKIAGLKSDLEVARIRKYRLARERIEMYSTKPVDFQWMKELADAVIFMARKDLNDPPLKFNKRGVKIIDEGIRNNAWQFLFGNEPGFVERRKFWFKIAGLSPGDWNKTEGRKTNAVG